MGLTYEQFRILVENTFWLKNQEEIGVVKAFIVSGSSEFGSLWLSETDGGSPLIPNAEYIYIVQTNGNFKNKLFSWNGSIYEQLAKDSDNNYTNADKSKVDKIIIDGDGTKYLSDDGEYKTVEAGIEEALDDSKEYSRKNKEWVKSSQLESEDGKSVVNVSNNNVQIIKESDTHWLTLSFFNSNLDLQTQRKSDDRLSRIRLGGDGTTTITATGSGGGTTFDFSLDNGRVAKLYDLSNLILLSGDWSGVAPPYVYEANIPLGQVVSSSDKPIIDLDLSSAIVADVPNLIADYAKIYRATTSLNKITFYATEKPTNNLSIQARVVK